MYYLKEAGLRWLRAQNVAVSLAFLMIVSGVGPADLAAQNPTPSGFPETPTVFNFNRDFIGMWQYTRSFTGFSCGSTTGAYGNPQGTCQYPVEQVESVMNGRAHAWLEFVDEPISGKWTCVAEGIQILLSEPYLWNLTARSDVVLQHFEQSNWVRSIWVDGRPHPPAEQTFQHGHSIGRMEGDEFVVETTNFVFDPDGWDDHIHMATSFRKKLTERYRAVGPGELEIEMTVEDPTFLNEPVTWTNPYIKTDTDFVGEWNCDPEVGLNHLYDTIPQRYADDAEYANELERLRQ